MTPQEALAALARPGWEWQIATTHFTSSATIYSVAGWAPGANPGEITVYVSSRPDFAEAVTLAQAEAARIVADAAAAPERSAA